MNKLTEVHDLYTEYYTHTHIMSRNWTSKQSGRHVYSLEVLIFLESHTLKID